MKRNLPALLFILVCVVLCAVVALARARAQQDSPMKLPSPQGVQFPNGKSQQDEILKQDHKKNLEDAATMAKLAEQVSEELEKDDRYVYSLKTLKNLDEIEKLSKTIRARLKKY